MPARNSHSLKAASVRKSNYVLPNHRHRCVNRMLVVTDTTGRSSLAARSSHTQREYRWPGREVRRGRGTAAATQNVQSDKPAIENGRASGSAIRGQISPSYLKPPAQPDQSGRERAHRNGLEP